MSDLYGLNEELHLSGRLKKASGFQDGYNFVTEPFIYLFIYSFNHLYIYLFVCLCGQVGFRAETIPIQK